MKIRRILLQLLFSIGKPIFSLFFYVLTFFIYLNKKLIWLYLITLTSAFFYWKILYRLPSPAELTYRPQKLTTQILDRNGKLLFKIYQDENRTPIKLNTLPPFVKNAFIAIEDKEFYSHQGFSVSGILRAFSRNINSKCSILNSKCPVEGGSTITQQLVKNALLTSEKTWERKAKELILAIATELTYDKDTILEMYINEVGFGGPIYGLEEASEQYFGIPAQKLNLAQAAFLAGLPKAPSKYSPFINPQVALERQHLVLAKLQEQNYITNAERETAQNYQLELQSPKIEIQAPHFVMYVRDLLVDQFGETVVSHGGLKVTTTLDLAVQQTAEKIISTELAKLTRLNVTNGAALVTEPQTGQILAMVGSENYFNTKKDGQVNLTTAKRQPGSSIKPVNYALAFEKGFKATSTLNDAPISIHLPGQNAWTPRNYDGRFHGTVTLRQALANSYNIPAILLLSQNGVKNMAQLGRQMGITTWNDDDRLGLSLTLGSVEVKMTDLAQVYGTFANSGTTVNLNPILKIENSTGKTLKFMACPAQNSPNALTIEAKDNPCQPQTVIKPQTANLITDILSDNAARSAAFGSHSDLQLANYKVAVKTGTSNDLRDNWTIGYTPNYVVAAWVGNNNNSPMSKVASGITGASPIWHKLMLYLLEHQNS